MMLDERQLARLRDDGFCVIPDVLQGADLVRAREALDRAVSRTERNGIALHDKRIDPNASNIRVNNLPEHDALFIELLQWPVARASVEALLGPNVIVSNFTANIALPGSQSMALHSDQALVIPPPWLEPWAMNVIWCLDDVDEANGATRYLPGSHRFRSFEDVPADAASQMRSFEASAGSFIAMEGRLWHTSGANVSADRQRRLMFAYYSKDFVRPQINWEAVLSPESRAPLDDATRVLMGLGKAANVRMGGALTRLATA